MRRRSSGRRPGRPLSGAEPLAERLTVMVTASMLSRVSEKSGGRVPEFVRAAIERALSGKAPRARRRRAVGASARSKRRYVPR